MKVKVDEKPWAKVGEPPYYRVDVFTSHWQQVKTKTKNVAHSIPKVKVDEKPYAVVGEAPFYRVDVFTLHWSQVKKNLKKVS